MRLNMYRPDDIRYLKYARISLQNIIDVYELAVADGVPAFNPVFILNDEKLHTYILAHFQAAFNVILRLTNKKHNKNTEYKNISSHFSKEELFEIEAIRNMVLFNFYEVNNKAIIDCITKFVPVLNKKLGYIIYQHDFISNDQNFDDEDD